VFAIRKVGWGWAPGFASARAWLHMKKLHRTEPTPLAQADQRLVSISIRLVISSRRRLRETSRNADDSKAW
jgi:hypothetical protein